MKMHFDGEALRYLDNLTLRMQKAEAEVERLAKINADCEQAAHRDDAIIKAYKTELAQLRKVADIAEDVVETMGMSDVLLSELAGRLADWETWKEGE